MSRSQDKSTNAFLDDSMSQVQCAESGVDEAEKGSMRSRSCQCSSWWVLGPTMFLLIVGTCTVAGVLYSSGNGIVDGSGSTNDNTNGTTNGTSRRLSSDTLVGTHAALWAYPSMLPFEQTADLGRNAWWFSDEAWQVYESSRDSDAARLRYIFGEHPKTSAIIYFPAFQADPGHNGTQLTKLNQVVHDFVQRNVTPIILIGRPEFYGNGSTGQVHDVVHDSDARAYLLARIADIIALQAIQEHVTFISMYWMGLSFYCTDGRCTPNEIYEFNHAIQDTIHNSSEFFQHLLHVDGPFWEKCWPQPCSISSFNYSGYTPDSIRQLDGLLAESWMQGSLQGGVQMLFDLNVFNASNVLLMNDVPNCDVYPIDSPCSTGSVQSDTVGWFQVLQNLNLNNTWSVWNYIDAGLTGNNYYGDAWPNTSTVTDLTTKGTLHRAQSLTDQDAV
eukprot:m.311387 g.311387  ORF g.311387 m.311387 type:complete len:444 (-) comp15953_c0_seq11:329-1660(-)